MTASAANHALYMGALIGIQDGTAQGWARAMAPGAPKPVVELCKDGEIVASGPCHFFSPVLQQGGIGDGHHAFVITLPKTITGPVQARIQGTTHWLGEEVGLLGQKQNATPFEGHLDAVMHGVITGWAWNRREPHEAVMLDLVVDGGIRQRILCDEFRQDLFDHGKGNGAHGFRAVLPLTLQDGQEHQIRLRFCNTNQELTGSPRMVPVMAAQVASVLNQASAALREFDRAVQATAALLPMQTMKTLVADTEQRLEYKEWVKRYDALSDKDRVGIARHILSMEKPITFSVVLPVYNTPAKWLHKTIESVSSQLYPYWELCIADDASTEPHVREVLEEWCKRDARIKVVYRKKNGHIAEATNSAVAMATGRYIAFLDHDDELAEHALYVMAAEAMRTKARLIYSDEDKIDEEGERHSPHFKPGWNYDLLLGANYICHLMVCESRLAKKIKFRSECNGSQDHDFVLRTIGHLKEGEIAHVPLVLYHWRSLAGSTALGGDAKPYAVKARLKAVADHVGDKGRVELGRFDLTRVHWQMPKRPPKVSIVIPTRDCAELLALCLSSLLDCTKYDSYEIVIIDNESKEDKTHALFKELKRRKQIRILPYPKAFNYSAINNFAVGKVKTPLVCLMNNDVQALHKDWLCEMVSQAMRPGIGAVGAKLLYPDGRIQHAGITLGINGVASHPFKGLTEGDPGYFARPHVTHQISACTAACLLVHRDVYRQVGGLNEKDLPVAFNDVDLCMKIREAGKGIVYTPYAVLRHHESFSRGYEDTPAKKMRAHAEIRYMQKRWGEQLLNDVFYNPNLTLNGEDYALAEPARAEKVWEGFLNNQKISSP